MNEPVAVAVLAKAPIPGFAETRLIPVLGARGAAMLQGRLVERAVETACAAAGECRSACGRARTTHPAFQSISARACHQRSRARRMATLARACWRPSRGLTPACW